MTRAVPASHRAERASTAKIRTVAGMTAALACGMDELVVRPRRLPGLLLTVFFVGMFSMNCYAFFVKPPSLKPGSVVIAVVLQVV
jgi:hypothetical protein